MKTLIIYAHPEPRSLNGALKDFMVRYLEEHGHKVQVSDLYQMEWKTTLDARDTGLASPDSAFDAMKDSERAFKNGTLSDDIIAEQQKLLWADTVIFQFPLWWFAMPAIMKGWIDRVYAYGFSYGVGDYTPSHWGDRYGEGKMSGKRAMLLVTTGGWESHFSPRGINGSMDELLFPIQHGLLFYPGFSVMPPFVVHRTGKIDKKRYEDICTDLQLRLDRFWIDEPIAYRKQNDGAYTIPDLVLKPQYSPGKTGLSVHRE